jgi:hypothetical protein
MVLLSARVSMLAKSKAPKLKTYKKSKQKPSGGAIALKLTCTT